ncbi:hypothetical protein TNCV_4170901 [Trichonephila clavipes]|nr:hypothetical protein TNCV_4170901 [Trichonephila clavipes]
MNLLMLSLFQVTRIAPELKRLLQTATPHQPQDFRIDRFDVHLSPLHGGSSGAPGLELVTCCPRVRDHSHKATAGLYYYWNTFL